MNVERANQSYQQTAHHVQIVAQCLSKKRIAVEETVVVPDHVAAIIEEVPAVDEIQETSATVEDSEEPQVSEVADEIEEVAETPVAQTDAAHDEFRFDRR